MLGGESHVTVRHGDPPEGESVRYGNSLFVDSFTVFLLDGTCLLGLVDQKRRVLTLVAPISLAKDFDIC